MDDRGIVENCIFGGGRLSLSRNDSKSIMHVLNNSTLCTYYSILFHCADTPLLFLKNASIIGQALAKALADGLKHCSSLQILNLESNNIGTDGAKALADVYSTAVAYSH